MRKGDRISQACTLCVLRSLLCLPINKVDKGFINDDSVPAIGQTIREPKLVGQGGQSLNVLVLCSFLDLCGLKRRSIRGLDSKSTLCVGRQGSIQ